MEQFGVRKSAGTMPNFSTVSSTNFMTLNRTSLQLCTSSISTSSHSAPTLVAQLLPFALCLLRFSRLRSFDHSGSYNTSAHLDVPTTLPPDIPGALYTSSAARTRASSQAAIPFFATSTPPATSSAR